MNKRRILIYCLLLLVSNNFFAQKAVYKDSKQSIETRVNDLVSQMTLKEKVSQLNQYTLGWNDNVNNVGEVVGGIPAEIGSLIYFGSDAELRNSMQKKAVEDSRLGIPILFGYDVIHGFRTVYPIPLAQACSWNTKLVEQACAMAGKEARMSGVDWTFSPMVDVARDGRWGRVAEGYGEDTYANAVFGEASIRGYQGRDNNLLNRDNIAACLKHYVGYGASEGGRDYVYTEISDQSLWDTYLQPFKKGVETGVATVMTSFNDIAGTPTTASHYLMTEVLKKQWGLEGFVVSDWGAIQQLRSQKVAADRKEAALKAFTAGVEMDMMNQCYDAHLETLVDEGKVSMDLIDDAVKRILKVKFQLGLFENPYTPQSQEKDRFLLKESIEIAKQMVEESVVLLKNENKILPLNSSQKIAFVGPLAKEKSALLGSWSAHGKADDVVSVFDGLEKELGKGQLLYAKGCDFEESDQSVFEEALQVAKQADVIVVALGEKKNWSGENASRSTLSLPAIQEELVFELKKLGKPIVLLLSSGRPLELNRLEPISDAIVQVWQPGIAGGNPIAGILSGRINPSGKLAITFPYSIGQIPIYYNHRQSGRTHQGKYQDIPNIPLYTFGHGLSYTDFEYGDIKLSTTSVKDGQKLKAEVTVKNIGDRDGLETVHWFVNDPVSTISRPVKELKHFEKRLIRKGETEVFEFDVNLLQDLGHIDTKGNCFLESGDYYILVKDKKVKVVVE